MFSVDVCCQTNDKFSFRDVRNREGIAGRFFRVQLNAMCVALISILQDL